MIKRFSSIALLYGKKIVSISKLLFFSKLAPILELQLFLTCISLPVLIGWGLPVSLVSICSTPLFAPLFTLFLLFSTVILITQLLHIPNAWPIYILECITNSWHYILSFNSPSWLISIVRPPIVVLLLLPAAALYILHQSHYKQSWQRALLFGVCLFGYIGLLKIATYIQPDKIYYIHCHDTPLTVVRHNGKLTIIDTGALGRRPCNQAWLEYTLMSSIRQQTGCDTITNLITLRCNSTTLEVIKELLLLYTIEHIYIPFYTTTDEKFLTKAWQLRQECKKNYCRWHPIKAGITNHLALSAKSWLDITGDSASITYNEIVYPRGTVHGIVHTKEIHISNSKTIRKGKVHEKRSTRSRV